MALPVTISDAKPGTRNSYHGPFKSSGGAFYTVLVDGGTGDDQIESHKATDPTTSFSEQDFANKPSMVLSGLDVVISLNATQSSDDLHCSTQNDAHDVFYARFDMANDIWDNLDGAGDRDIIVDGAPNGTADACDIAVLSAAYGVGSAFVKIRVVYQGATDMDMGAEMERIDESNSVDDGVTWSGPTQIDNGASAAGTHYRAPRIVKHPSDDQCFIFMLEDDEVSAPDLILRAIAGDDTLRTRRDTGQDTSSTAVALYLITHGIGFTRSSTGKIRIGIRQTSTNDLIAYEFDAFADDTDPTPGDSTSIIDSGNVGVANSSINACLAADGSVIRGLTEDFTSNDLFEFFDDDADSYTLQGTAHVVGTVNHISCKVYDRSGPKLAMIYDDASTVKYDEIDLAVAAALPLGTLALLGVGI